MVNFIALFVALCLSGVSAYYSIVGLTAIFSSAVIPVILMGSALEMGKLVTASWLYNNWDHASKALRTYLTLAVIVLMFITSLGIYGFFARAHIEQQIQLTTGETSRLPLIESKIKVERQKLADLDKQIAQIDTAVSTMTEKSKATKDARSALAAAQQQRKTRDGLVASKDSIFAAIAELETEKSRLDNVVKKNEVEVGPLKYLAKLYYGEANASNLEHAVQMLILTLVFVFDPLAIALLLASNHTASIRKQETKPVRQDIVNQIVSAPVNRQSRVIPMPNKAAKLASIKPNNLRRDKKPTSTPILKRPRKRRKALDMTNAKF